MTLSPLGLSACKSLIDKDRMGRIISTYVNQSDEVPGAEGRAVQGGSGVGRVRQFRRPVGLGFPAGVKGWWADGIFHEKGRRMASREFAVNVTGMSDEDADSLVLNISRELEAMPELEYRARCGRGPLRITDPEIFKTTEAPDRVVAEFLAESGLEVVMGKGKKGGGKRGGC